MWVMILVIMRSSGNSIQVAEFTSLQNCSVAKSVIISNENVSVYCVKK